MSWIEIFRTGTHTDSQGRTRAWTEADLDKMVSTYDPAKAEAPLVLGHPKDNAPAYGWVESLKRSGEVLLAQFKQVPDAVKQLVADGRFKKRSISVYADGRLRHVGLLGAVPPAVQGLKEIGAFSGGEDISQYEEEFSNPPKRKDQTVELEELKRKLEEERKAREAAENQAKEFKSQAEKTAADFAAAQKKQRRVELEARIDKLVSDAKVLPAEKAAILQFAETLDTHGSEIEFSAGEGKKALVDHFFGWMESRAKHGLFAEFKAKGEDDNAPAIDYANITTKV